MRFKCACFVAVAALLLANWAAAAESNKVGPAEGYTIHVLAPHQMEDGTVGGPFHHYCKPVQKGMIFQCLLFKSTNPDAELVGIEFFVDKQLARRNVQLIQWNRHSHDHALEIASARVLVVGVCCYEHIIV